MTDAKAPNSQPFAEEETPTVIAGRRHLRTLALPKLEAAPPPAECAAAAPESSRQQ
jgi:hypothetical protein